MEVNVPEKKSDDADRLDRWSITKSRDHQIPREEKETKPKKHENICSDILASSLYRFLQFAKLPRSHCYFSIWLFCQVNLPVSPVHFANGKVHIAQLSSPVAMSAFPSHQFHIAKSILPNCQVHSTLWSAQMRLSCPQKIKFWAVQCLNIFSGPSKLLPKKLKLPLFFSQAASWPHPLHPLPLFLPSLSLSFVLVGGDLMALWSLRGALSKFKLSSETCWTWLPFKGNSLKTLNLLALSYRGIVGTPSERV